MAQEPTQPTLSMRMDREEQNLWTRLAREKGYSRSDLIRKVLTDVGLEYARGLQPTQTGAGYQSAVAA